MQTQTGMPNRSSCRPVAGQCLARKTKTIICVVILLCKLPSGAWKLSLGRRLRRCCPTLVSPCCLAANTRLPRCCQMVRDVPAVYFPKCCLHDGAAAAAAGIMLDCWTGKMLGTFSPFGFRIFSSATVCAATFEARRTVLPGNCRSIGSSVCCYCVPKKIGEIGFSPAERWCFFSSWRGLVFLERNAAA